MRKQLYSLLGYFIIVSMITIMVKQDVGLRDWEFWLLNAISMVGFSIIKDNAKP
jgi:hypothetical protein